MEVFQRQRPVQPVSIAQGGHRFGGHPGIQLHLVQEVPGRQGHQEEREQGHAYKDKQAMGQSP